MAQLPPGQAEIAMESVQVGFQFEKVFPPAMNDVATYAEFKILRGRLDPNSAGIEALRNGRLPATEDQPAEITQRGLAAANYDASYRVTGNFLDYLTQSHDKEIVARLNAAARNGRYDADFWSETLGKSALELDTEWKNYCRQKIDQAKK